MERRFIGRRGRAHSFDYLRREEAGLEGRQVIGGNEFDGAGLEGVFSSFSSCGAAADVEGSALINSIMAGEELPLTQILEIPTATEFTTTAEPTRTLTAEEVIDTGTITITDTLRRKFSRSFSSCSFRGADAYPLFLLSFLGWCSDTADGCVSDGYVRQDVA